MRLLKAMESLLEYRIVAQAFHGAKATHLDLEEKVKELLEQGYEPLGAPFNGEEMMYQAMIKRNHGRGIASASEIR